MTNRHRATSTPPTGRDGATTAGGRRPGDIVRALAALLGLAVLLAAPPVLLVAFVGNPVPIGQSLTHRLGDDAALRLLSTLGWLAWAHLAACVAVETAAARGRGIPRHIPLGGFSQQLARRLITAALLLTAGAGTITLADGGAPAAPPAVTAQVEITPAAAGAAAVGVATPTPTALPQRPRQPVDEAARARGLPVCVVQPPTGRFHDSLWAIAQRHLGDGRRWQQIWQLNHDLAQPDGSHLDQPDLIHPGWRLLLPADADGVAASPPPAAPSPTRAADRPGASTGDRATAQGTHGTATADPERARPGADRDVPVGRTAPPAPPTPPANATAPARPTAQPAVPATGQGTDNVVPLPFALAGGAGLLSACVLAAVRRMRRRQQTNRRPGRQIRLPDPPARRVEAALAGAERPDRVEFLDLALRSLASALAERVNSAPPEVLAALLDTEQLTLVLAAPDPTPPPPFRADSDGRRWSVPLVADLPVDRAHARENLAPLPALATAGHDLTTTVLLDLEGLRTLSLVGDRTRTLDLLRFLAAELAYNRWSDHLLVTLVGFGEDLVAVNPERLRHRATLPEALQRLELAVGEVRDTLADTAAGGVLAGRVADVAGDAWMPEVVLLADAPHGEDADRLRRIADQLADTGRAALALVAAGELPGARWTATVTADGRFELPPLGVSVPAAGISRQLVPDLVTLLTVARGGADEPVPPARDVAGWSADGLDAAGGLLPPESGTHPAAPAPPVPPDGDAGQGRPAAVLPFSADAARRVQIEARDPSLDADADAWTGGDPTLARVAVIGPVEVTAPGQVPKNRIAWYSEVVAYLATRPRSAATAGDITAALWPDKDPDPATRREALSTARRWLGEDRDGRLHLPNMGADQLYRLGPHVILDWTLFRRLRARGEARGPDGAHDLRRALELVRGRPFANTRPGRYAWLAQTGLLHHITSAVVDTAHLLARHRLAAGDPAAARWAAQTAQLADDLRDADLPFLDLMAAARMEGRNAELEALLGELMALRSAEVEEDLQPDTLAAIDRLLPRRRAYAT